MLRLALLLCYLTATLAGSRPCCCTDLFARRASAGQAADAKPAPAKHSCPLCAAEKKPEQPKPEAPAPAKKPNCPCPKAVAKAPAVPLAIDDRSATADGFPVEHVPLTVPTGVVRVIHPGPPPDPSPQLLLLCQRLRC